MKLVINADDFGFTKGVCDGIIEGVKSGIVRSTTAMCNMPYLSYGKELADNYPELAIGVHLNLTVGYSLTKNETLTDNNGKFLNKKIILSSEINYNEVYNEWKAQIERFIEIFGKLPSHLDSHHDVHDYNEQFYAITQKLASEYGLSVRRHGDYKFSAAFYDETATIENLLNILKTHDDSDIEIMVHPGFCDLELYKESSYNTQRVVELAVLCDESILKFINEKNIVLSHY